MRFVAWFQIVVGTAVAGLWTVLLLARQVPEVEQDRVDIWFHIVAELVMAALLLGGGVALLHRARAGRLVAGLALGWLGYSAINSAGYYAESGDWPVVAGFALIVAVAAAAFTVLCRQVIDRSFPAPDAVRTHPARSPGAGTNQGEGS